MNTLLISLTLFTVYFEAMPPLPVKENFENPMENPNLFGGDMVGVNLIDGDYRNAIPNDAGRWPGGVIYYTIDPSLASHADIIKQAQDHIHQKVGCISFQPRTNQKDYVNYFLGTGCFSNVGKTGGPQQISLGNGCWWLRTAAHETIHAIGFFHEQNRSDRDNYITIHNENIDAAKLSQFALLQPNQNRLLAPFDFDSIMLYGPTAFTKNGGITMSSKVAGKAITDHSPSLGLSADDIASIKKLYGCS